MHPACDRAIADHARDPVETPGRAGDHPRLILATTILASSLAFVDGSVVNVGLPALSHSLGAQGSSLTWVLNGFTLPLSALLLLGGALGDGFGRRRLLIIGVTLFTIASLFCALSANLGELIAGRVLQGGGAALLLPNSLAILGAKFTGASRGRAIGIWAGVGAAAGAVGPVLGGWLIDRLGWRAIFFLNLPLGVACVVLAVRFVKPQDSSGRPALDLSGALLVTGALTMLTWALTIASSSKPLGAEGFGILAAGVALLGVFVIVERRRGAAAMLPVALFSSRSFVSLNTFTWLLYGAMGALLVSIPFVLIESLGYSATAAGAALLPLPLTLAVLSPIIGRVAGKSGFRGPLTAGSLVVAVGCVLATRIGSTGGYWTTTFPPLIVVSLGMAGAVAPLTTAVLGSVAAEHVGVASGFNSAVARTGGLVATALLSAILVPHHQGNELSFRYVAYACTAACCLAAVCSFLIRDVRRN